MILIVRDWNQWYDGSEVTTELPGRESYEFPVGDEMAQGLCGWAFDQGREVAETTYSTSEVIEMQKSAYEQGLTDAFVR